MINKLIQKQLFHIQSDQEFNELCLKIFRYQHSKNPVYRKYLKYLRINPDMVSHYTSIPFLPIELFKSHKVCCSDPDVNTLVFSSSGTTGQTTSKHFVTDPELYQRSFLSGFKTFYGSPDEYIILALLPAYLDRQDSSLVYMVDHLIRNSGHPKSGFYLKDTPKMLDIIKHSDRPVLLLGVTFALLDMVENTRLRNQNLIVMETGGMKGRRKEMIREEVHEKLKNGFGVDHIHSEYGMTELLSQAYSSEKGIFRTPPWMRVLVRDTDDPLSIVEPGKSGGLNIIDLANINSCSFIATQDLGRSWSDGSFEVLGRFDYSDIRGCNLMVG